MAEWLSDPKLWIMVLGVVAQSGVVWWRVGEHGNKLLAHDEDLESLREWRAEAREQIRQLQNGS